MFSFTAIDFETATGYIPCSVGLAVFKENSLVEVKNFLIHPICYPYFQWYAQKIHGIHKEDVKDSPTFEELYSIIQPYLEDTVLIAHNAAFDINVLRRTLQYYDIARPKSHYICSYLLARKAWPTSEKFSLDYISNRENIVLNHHHSDSDAEVAGKIFLKEMEILGIDDFSNIKPVTGLRLNKI